MIEGDLLLPSTSNTLQISNLVWIRIVSQSVSSVIQFISTDKTKDRRREIVLLFIMNR